MYRKLLLVLNSTFNAHLSIVRIRISALAKTAFVGSNADSTLLRHAYTTQPYCNTLDTSEFINCNLTRTFEIPNILQLVRTAWNVRRVLFILSYSIHSGLLLLFDIMRPKYLNFYTTSTYLFLTFSLP